MKINIKVPVAPVARQKKSPEIAKNIIQSVNSETNEVVSIKVIPNTFNGINNNIPVTSCYIDSDGDLVKISKFEGRTLVEIEMCDKSLKEIEELKGFFLFHLEELRKSFKLEDREKFERHFKMIITTISENLDQ